MYEEGVQIQLPESGHTSYGINVDLHIPEKNKGVRFKKIQNEG